MAAKTVVIVGGGFAGVYAARYLQKWLPRDWDIILFSRENHFIFTPLLGDVVGSSINPMHVVWPIRQMARRVTCRTAALTALDLQGHAVVYRTTQGQEARQSYKQLVLACGSVVNLDIIPGMAAHGWPLKTMGDALMLRNHLIGLLEKAQVETDPATRRRLLSVIVVGAGFSGVEVAGEVNDLLKGSLKFYGNHQASDIRVTLLQGQQRILAELPLALSTFATRKMQEQGIDIRVNAVAGSVTERGVRLKDGSEVEGATVICTIGTTVSPLLTQSGLPLLKGRVQTGPDMLVEGQSNVWALGDCAAVPNAHDGSLCIPTAQLATRQGKHLARNMVRTLAGQPMQPFAYKPLGMLASIGNHKAVGLVFGFKVSGLFAWLIWRGIYLGKMPTLARKVQIAFDWAWQILFPRDIVQLSLEQTERLTRAHFEAGQWVFHQGDPGARFYIIERGKAGVYLDEAAPPVAVLEPGQHFGEGALLRDHLRSASVKAEETLDVLMLGPGSFKQLTQHFEVLRGALERSVQQARSSRQLLEMAQHHPRLNSLSAGAVMSGPVETLPLDLNFAEALERSQRGKRGAYPVVAATGHMVGLCTRSDFYRAVQQLKPPQTPLREVMRTPVLTVRTTDSLTTALLLFMRHPIKRLVVVAPEDAQRPVGMLTPFDILRVLSTAELLAAQPG